MDIKQLHDLLFDVLLFVDDACEKEGVRYFLDSGTELGAVREKNFIPWDDDIDIKVLREDYPAFKAAIEKHMPPHYRFVEPADLAPAFFDFIPRIIDTEKPLREQTEEDIFYGNTQNRVGVDIFILDKAPDSPMAQKLMSFKCKMYYGMAMSKRFKQDRSGYSAAQKLVTGVLWLMGKPFSIRFILRRYEKAMTAYQKKRVSHRFPSNYPLSFLSFFKDEWYGETVGMPIRDHSFPVPARYHEELTAIYGDYMTPHRDPAVYKTHI